MPRLRNDTGHPLEIRVYGRTVWPGEEVTTEELGHDMDTAGVITGLTVVDEPAAADEPAEPRRGRQRDTDQTTPSGDTGKEQTQ